jgi:hypothetical protein
VLVERGGLFRGPGRSGRIDPSERSDMANHLTPDELSIEVGIERDEVIRICMEEHVPIYHGKIDKSLFQAQLQSLGALPQAH